MNSNASKTRFALICVIPATLLFALFMLYPTFQVFRMSLYKWGGFSAKKTFVYFDNFVKLFNDTKFIRAFQNTIV